MRAGAERIAWVSYLRVSTPDQADRELSLPAQRRAVEEFATRHHAHITREYVEAGCSGANPHRPVFRRMLEDVLRPGSDVATIVVHHTSRFTPNSTEARVVKSKLRRIGVRVLSTSHELTDDPIGKLMEGLLECFDQYESEINGVRTAAPWLKPCARDTSQAGRLRLDSERDAWSPDLESPGMCSSRSQRRCRSFERSFGYTSLLAEPRRSPASSTGADSDIGPA